MHWGEAVHQLDAKGRVFVPKRIQESLSCDSDGTRAAYLSRGQDSCLNLFSESGFEQAVEELKSGLFSGEELRAAQRLFFANTVRVELDGSGRLLIPEKLRTRAGIEKEVVFVGVGVKDRAEIWAREVWDRYESTHQEMLDRIDLILANRNPRPPASG